MKDRVLLLGCLPGFLPLAFHCPHKKTHIHTHARHPPSSAGAPRSQSSACVGAGRTGRSVSCVTFWKQRQSRHYPSAGLE